MADLAASDRDYTRIVKSPTSTVGNEPATPLSPCCAPRQAMTRTTGPSPTSSASFRCAATPPAAAGSRTKFTSTTSQAARGFVTRSSASCTLRSAPSRFPGGPNPVAHAVHGGAHGHARAASPAREWAATPATTVEMQPEQQPRRLVPHQATFALLMVSALVMTSRSRR